MPQVVERAAEIPDIRAVGFGGASVQSDDRIADVNKAAAGAVIVDAAAGLDEFLTIVSLMIVRSPSPSK